MASVSARVDGLRDELSEQSRLLLLGLCAASLLVLLVACTNLANLLLARTLVRRRELVVRTALGAGRERLARQLVTESVLLTGLGGALGVLAAIVSVPLLTRLIPTNLPLAASPSVDGRVLLFAAVVTGLVGLGFGTVPALRAAGAADRDGFDALREGARGGSRSRLRAVLVSAQVMACIVLLVGSGLLVRALLRVQAIDPGFRATGAFMLRTALPMPEYATRAKREAFYRDVLARTRALPGVTGAAYVSYAPLTMGGGIFPVEIPGKTQDRAAGHRASLRFATPGYFPAMGITLRRGRDLAETDDSAAVPVAVVSESFARRYWPNEDPLGRRFTFGFMERTIVGVVADVKVRGLERRSEPQVYLSYRQVADSALPAWVPKDLVVRASASGASLVPAIRAIVRDADPRLPVSDVQSLEELVEGQTATRAVQVRVLGGFAAATFLLAAIGIHGLLSFVVANRRREFGVRMALGATTRDVLALVMRQSIALTLAGVVPGLVIALMAGRAMQALLAGVTPLDTLTYGAAVALCVAMGVLGGLAPAVRATRVPPSSALRAD
jgi:putative ABC transport system permease protein